MAAKKLGNVFDDPENKREREDLDMATNKLGNVFDDPQNERERQEIKELELSEEHRKKQIAQLEQQENLRPEDQMRLKELQAKQERLDKYRKEFGL